MEDEADEAVDNEVEVGTASDIEDMEELEQLIELEEKTLAVFISDSRCMELTVLKLQQSGREGRQMWPRLGRKT